MSMKNKTYEPMVNVYQHNKWIAFSLCLFLGVFGAHKFYEGKIAIGFIYCLTLGGLGIGIIIDLVSYLNKTTYYRP